MPKSNLMTLERKRALGSLPDEDYFKKQRRQVFTYSNELEHVREIIPRALAHLELPKK